MKRGLQLVLGTVLFFFGWVSASPGTELLQLDKYQRMAYRVKPAIVRVLAMVQGTVAYETEQGEKLDENNGIGGMGSGFIVHPSGYIVTNGHVVGAINTFNQRKEVVEKMIWGEFVQKVLKQKNLPLTQDNVRKVAETIKPRIVGMKPINFVILSNLKDYRFEIKQFSKDMVTSAIEKGGEGKDIAILKIEAKNLPTVKLGDSDRVRLQELVFAFGYPGAADTSFLDYKSKMSEVSITRGTISAVKADFKGVPIIQSDVTITHGNSGGPSVNENGEVIGVNSYGEIRINPILGIPEDVPGFNYLVPINTAKEFINAAGVKEETSLFNEIYHQALEKVWANEFFEGRDLLNKALVFIPDQPDIIKLRMDVETAISKMGWVRRIWQTNKIAVISLGIILILILGVGATFMMKKGPQRAAPQPVKQPAPSPVPPEGATKVDWKGLGSLTLSTGTQLGKSYAIGEKGLVIGREAGQCDIVIPDSNVSRVHAWVTVEKGEVVVIDRGSTNGTFVNNNKVEKAKLKPGDVIHLGQKCPTTLIYNK